MTDPIGIHDLADALDLGAHEHVSLIGGGGKTTALFALGRQLPGRVVLTTTTKMGRSRTGGHRLLVGPDDAELAAALDADGAALVWRSDDEQRALGVDPSDCDRWFAAGYHVVVEADGSRRRPFKAPRPYEPVVPASTTVLVACVGADALDTPIDEACLRPEIVARIAGCETGDRLDPARLAAVLMSAEGSRKGLPDGARFAVLVHRVADGHRPFIEDLAARLPAGQPLVAIAPFGPDESPG